ncbi:hypothetical protein [Acetatifactor aquisgranensis]|uniref:hypothetical protein n=1 Tax=Acetatifactor aquisgranensis TaxID=2941233 RepID=UPI00203D6CD8|nr:hypothetical protein [Acetatifactor aquisgranensis]
MRLINADALIGILRHDIDCYDTGKPDNEIYINAKDVENMINGQATAFDVDKVMEQMEEKVKSYDNPVSSDSKFRKFCHGIATGFRYAIEIVEGGWLGDE